MNIMIPLLPVPKSRRRMMSGLALLATSVSLVALATPAQAQCVEGPPNSYGCGGQNDTTQAITDPDPSVTTTAGFGVDTSGNGNGMALTITGPGRVSYTDLNASSLSGAGVRFSVTGGVDDLSPGEMFVLSGGTIVANGENGLRLDNNGGGDTQAVWLGSISNIGGNGVFTRNEFGGGDLGLTVADVTARDDGIWAQYGANGSVVITATGAVTGATGAGVRINAGTAADDVQLNVADVTGGSWGIRIDSSGTDFIRVVATGTVTGQGEAGISIQGGLETTGIDVFANRVNGQTLGIQVGNFGTGATNILAAGPVTAATSFGIIGFNDVNATDLSISSTDVVGNLGIIASNTGTGSTSVVSTGTVVGFTVDGIVAENGVNTHDLLIDVNNVEGQTNGMVIQNFGSGVTSVRASGTVTGQSSFGIDIVTGTGAQGVVVDVADVSGGFSGVSVRHDGTGSIGVSSTGLVSGSGLYADGIEVRGGLGTTDILIQAADVQGGHDGIYASNNGTGQTLIRSTGLVLGTGFGILAESGAGSTDVLIRANNVQSTGNGIVAVNLGTGETSITTLGTVIGQGENGIAVDNGVGGTDIRVDAATVSGGLIGIRTTNGGTGESFITTTGLVSGSIFGILAQNDVNATDLSVHATDVQSQSDAILAENFGSGETSIIATGNVIGQNQVGIRVFADTNADDITVEAENASGGFSGISVVNLGLGDTRVTVNGTVQGGDNAINVVSNNGQGVVIINHGIVSNASGLSADRAISATGSVGIGNTGSLIGTLDISGTNSLVLNAGTWRSIGGTSIFGTADDELFNSSTGTIVGGVAAATAETTTWQGLERFQNAGVLRLQDGGTGDLVQTSAATIFANGSGLTVDIGGATGSDMFRTTGTVQIEAGSRLQSVTGQPLVLHGKHVVVQADGGLSGQFIFADQFLTAFAGLRDGYTATTAFIEFAQLRALADAGITPNQKETAGGADSLPNGNAVKDALLLLPNDAAAQDAFDQLSGEIHPSARGAMVEDSRLLRNAVLDRLADSDQGSAVWGRAFADTGISDGDLNAAKVNRDTRGFMIGLDRAIGPVTIGVAGGWSDTDLRIARRDSKASVETIHGLLYAGGQFGRFNLRGGVGYARTSTETERRIAFQGFSAAPRADYHGSVLQGFVEAGYRVPLGGGHVEPYAGLTAIRARTDAFKEAAGPAALSGKAISEDSYGSTLGLRFETSRAGALSLRGTMAWRHGWGDLTPAGRHAFDGGTDFTVLGASGSRDAGIARVEAQYRLSSNVTLGVAYDGVLGTGGEGHAITGGLKIVF